ncbi:MAG: XRE family transcriptional regulator [Schleiferilactobacillus perolens]|uniref:LexA family protein n=1 Tax=Schleiferilactobacillus perolens TaxID=100468 RepID=UPI0039EC8BEE
MIGSVLKKLREQKGFGVNQLAAKSGVSASQISRIENGIQNSPTVETIKKLSAALHDSDGQLLKATLSTTDKPSPLDRLIAHTSEHINMATEPIQVYGTIHAGNAVWADEDIIGELMVTPHLIQKYGRENLFALKITGESMNKRIPNGYVALFSRDCEVDNGDIVAVLIDGDDAMVKVYEKTSKAIIFKPDSWLPGFKSYVYHKDDEQDFQILGKYVYSTDYPI